MRHRVLPFLLTLAIGCSRGPAPQPFGSPMRPAPVDFDSALTWLDRRIGLPPLSGSMPTGYREFRLDVDCGACSPTYMIRLLEEPTGRVRGEIWMESLRWVDTFELGLRRQIGCGAPRIVRDSADMPLEPEERDLYMVCRGGTSRDWRPLLAAIERSALLPLLSGTREWRFPGKPQTSVTQPDGTRLIHFDTWDCGDIATRSFTLRLLDDRGPRSGVFDCLESQEDTSAVRRRAATLHTVLMEIVRPVHE